jgi:cytochrome c oxidase subunit 1
MILPGMGVVSELITAFSRQRVFGYPFVAIASIAIAVLGFLVWGHHMFVAGMSAHAALMFSILSYLVAIPSAIKVFNWTATLFRGSIAFDTPLLYALGFVGLFTTGRMYSEALGKLAALTIFLGFNLTFFPQYVVGYLGMPRRYHVYPPDFQVFHVLSTAGASILAVGYLLPLVYLLYSLRRGQLAGPNPWQSTGLEWRTDSPPPPHNFAETPIVTEPPYSYPTRERDDG